MCPSIVTLPSGDSARLPVRRLRLYIIKKSSTKKLKNLCGWRYKWNIFIFYKIPSVTGKRLVKVMTDCLTIIRLCGNPKNGFHKIHETNKTEIITKTQEPCDINSLRYITSQVKRTSKQSHIKIIKECTLWCFQFKSPKANMEVSVKPTMWNGTEKRLKSETIDIDRSPQSWRQRALTFPATLYE